MAAEQWTRKEYASWDEAFHGLAPLIRQQSVRIAEYTQTVFIAACSSPFGKDTGTGADRMKGQFADAAYKCGLYHQIGKALVPPEYQIWRGDFTEEELSVYRKYTTDGRLLAARLQERSARAQEKRRSVSEESSTKNIPWLMIRESCEQHMERYDGTGYPSHLAGREISPIAQIVGIVKELDGLSSGIKSEHPFDEAFEKIQSQSGSAWNPLLVDVLVKCREKCFGIYTKYIHYTQTIPETIPLVPKTEGRPMGLSYRPVVSDGEGTVAGYEAIPWFFGSASSSGEAEGIPEVEEMLKRTNLLNDITFYHLYEAADTLLRIQNCKIDIKFLAVRVSGYFFKQGSQLQRFQELYENQPIDKSKLILLVPGELLPECTKTFEELLARYSRNGIALGADISSPEQADVIRFGTMGIRLVRVSPAVYNSVEGVGLIAAFRNAGMIVTAGEVADESTSQRLMDFGADAWSGPIIGRTKDEEELIRDALLKERA